MRPLMALMALTTLTLLGIAGGWVAFIKLEPNYQSTVVIEITKHSFLCNLYMPAASGHTVQGPPQGTNLPANHIAQLSSERVFMKAVEMYKLDRIELFEDCARSDQFEFFLERLEVKQTPESDIYRISFRGAPREDLKTVLNGLVIAYKGELETQLQSDLYAKKTQRQTNFEIAEEALGDTENKAELVIKLRQDIFSKKLVQNDGYRMKVLNQPKRGKKIFPQLSTMLITGAIGGFLVGLIMGFFLIFGPSKNMSEELLTGA